MSDSLQYNIPIEFQGVPEQAVQILQVGMGKLIQLAAKVGLDLSRLERVVIAADYPAALRAVDRGFGASREVQRTEEDYAHGVAMALPVVRDGEAWTVLIMDAGTVCGLFSEEPGAFELVTGLVIHELAHVHDHQMKAAAFEGIWLTRHVDAKVAVLQGCADSAWSEYYASRISVHVDPEQLARHIDTLRAAFDRVWTTTQSEIIDYRTSADLNRVWSIGEQQAAWLIQCASYVVGSLDGLGMTLAEAAPDLEAEIAESYFGQTWTNLQAALRAMWETYPGWQEAGLEAYRPVMDVAEENLEVLGFELSLSDDGRLYINIPFSAHTLPPGASLAEIHGWPWQV